MSFLPSASNLQQSFQSFFSKRVDSRLKFSLVPLNGENGQEEWRQAMRAVTRLPGGIPEYFRVKLWTTLADNHITSSNIDWEEVKRTAFSEKVQDADEQIHSQIIKDLHRTGWDGFNDEKRLKQLLLAYARYNKDVGYCQGFNVIGALILQIVDYNTSDALKVLIFLIEQVLPRGYFDQSLRALSVDMSVMKDLLLQRLPRTVEHLEMLQSTSGNEYEPPLTNVFSMHWLLTLFATCLPRKCVFRIWDAVMLEGSEILLRTAIAIWAKLSRRVLTTKTADQFYGLMEKLSKQLVEMSELDQDSLLTVIYSMSEFPYPGLADLRDKYTWNIQPLSANFKLFQRSVDQILHEESDTETTCSPCRGSGKPKSREKPWKSDVHLLQKQYKLMLKRQRQASVILHSAFLHGQSALSSRLPPSTVVPNMNITHQPMFNHLHMGHTLADQNISCEAPASLSGGALALAPTMVQPVEGETTPRNSPVPSRQYRSSHNFQREQCNITPTPTCNQLIDDVFISDCEDPYDSPTPYSPSIHKSPIQKRSAEQQAMMKRSKALLNTICTPPVPPPLPIPVGRRNQSYSSFHSH